MSRVAPGRSMSALVWGTREPEIVLLHGGAQNAHTWDTVALALGRPLVAIDLPGHGHSGWRDDGAYGPVDNSAALAVAIDELAPKAAGVVGMSLGGMTAIVLASRHPELEATSAGLLGEWSDRHGLPSTYATALRARLALE